MHNLGGLVLDFYRGPRYVARARSNVELMSMISGIRANRRRDILVWSHIYMGSVEVQTRRWVSAK